MDEEIKKIDINQAGVEALTEIPGIAENLAQRIIEYRETVHPFEEVIELAAVPGISERMVREFAEWVTVEPVAAMERRVTVPTISLEPKAEPAIIEDAPAEEELFEFVTDVEEEPDAAEETSEEHVESVMEEVVEEIEEPEAEDTAVPQPITWPTGPQPDEDDTADLPPLYEPMKVEPAHEPQPRPVAQPAAQPSQGRVLGQILLGSILGAFVGALLTLAILAALNNGTLSFNQADTRLQSEIQDAQQSQSDLQQTVDNLDSQLNTNLSAVATRTGDLFLQQQEIDTSVQDIMSGMRQTNANVAELEAITNALDERLTTVAAAAETFDAFLDGLRGLLSDLDGSTDTTSAEEITPAETLEATIEASPTASSDAGDDGTKATAVPTPTSPPTRTPRPTATPIPLPTSTPGQQP
jgi:competence ComEA-like helix-hairpin-helix protein